MRLDVTNDSIGFLTDDNRLAGRYVYDDGFKPYLHPLQTPSGVSVSAFMPHDHKHHRALMYALRTPELNFWEERPTLSNEQVGRQVHKALAEVTLSGDVVGFAQTLEWCALDSSVPLFIETRSISCSLSARTFSWTWDTQIEVRSDTVLRMSQWSAKQADGSLVNYHGLGLRLPREFSGDTAKVQIRLDGALANVSEAHGQVPQSIEFVGAVDGYWPVRFAGVRVEQKQPNALFLMKDPFAYIALGPSNQAPRTVKRGDLLTEKYRIDVFDAEPL